jgi:energy-coupling factor transport system ATP-binding protein
VIAMRPDCIVLDEPTAMLDPRGRREVLSTIKKLNREFGVTVVLITHFMDEAAQSERVVVMDGGKIILDATPEEVFSHVEQLKSVGLDVPQATELCHELRAGGVDLPNNIITEETCVEAIAAAVPKGALGGHRIEVVEPKREDEAKRKAILKTENLTYLYSEGTPFEKAAIRDVNLEIEEGAFVGIIGHTGSGKSTLIQHFNGLLRPNRGKIFVDGEDIWAQPKQIRKFRFKVGLVFQYPEYQLFEETVFKDIAFGPRNMGLSEEEVRYRVKSVAELVELKPSVMEKSPFELSGGQKRRVALAGVMAMTPDVLVLDEPTAGLDPRGRDRILSEIREYHRQQKNTILLVSHSMEDVAKYAEKVLVMNESEVYLYDDVDKVFAHADEIGKMGLAVPQVTRICQQLSTRGYGVSPHTYTVEHARDQILSLAGRGGAGC